MQKDIKKEKHIFVLLGKVNFSSILPFSEQSSLIQQMTIGVEKEHLSLVIYYCGHASCYRNSGNQCGGTSKC